MTETEPLPTPEEAAALALQEAREGIRQLRELVRREILRQAATSRDSIYVELSSPAISSSIAFDAVKTELEGRGWAVQRDSSPKNESFMVLKRR